mmetsp:Transcript_90086/g.263386  ORF Transcript_90086/g.263386 Transcript_90086/m.263386 type:complete len:213 (+) Transcript_90086:267-905(+)
MADETALDLRKQPPSAASLNYTHRVLQLPEPCLVVLPDASRVRQVLISLHAKEEIPAHGEHRKADRYVPDRGDEAVDGQQGNSCQAEWGARPRDRGQQERDLGRVVILEPPTPGRGKDRQSGGQHHVIHHERGAPLRSRHARNARLQPLDVVLLRPRGLHDEAQRLVVKLLLPFAPVGDGTNELQVRGLRAAELPPVVIDCGCHHRQGCAGH